MSDPFYPTGTQPGSPPLPDATPDTTQPGAPAPSDGTPVGSDTPRDDAPHFTVGQPLAVTEVMAALTAPKRIGGYELRGELGRGGMGVVYKAYDPRLNREIALKMILAAKASPKDKARFDIEMEAVARLEHPGIVRLYNSGVHDGEPYFALEYIAGGSLYDALKRRERLAPRDAAGVTADLADAIAHAHSRGVIHRDLKPGNVLLAGGGPSGASSSATHPSKSATPPAALRPKVSDFGLARIGEAQELTRTGDVLGSPAYMAPEQADGRVKDVGTATDIYALGAVLYCMLTGRPPFLGKKPLDILRQVKEDEPTPPRVLSAETPRDIETICLKCLRKEPGRRYASAAALADDLRNFLAGRPITARPVGPAERAWKWAKRHPYRTAALAAGMAVAMGLVAGAAWVRHDRERIQAAGREQERVGKVTGLVSSLATADTAAVTGVVGKLDDHRDLADPALRTAAGANPVTSKAGLHARVALALRTPFDPADATAVDDLVGHLPHCDPANVPLLRDALVPHGPAVAPRLWAVLHDESQQADRRARVACVLAGIAPADDRWTGHACVLTEYMVTRNPLELNVWADALTPVRDVLVPRLIERYEMASVAIGDEKLDGPGYAETLSKFNLAATLLTRYAKDRPTTQAEFATLADPLHYAAFFATIQDPTNPPTYRETVRVALRKKLSEPPAAAATDRKAEIMAARRVNVAAVLLALGDADPVWPLLRHSSDPTTRSLLVRQMAAFQADPHALIARFKAESDVSARRALVIALGDFPRDAAFAASLLADYRTDPDPGLHSAINWLLRVKWGEADRVAKIDAELKGKPDPKFGWYVNGQGQTMAVVREPVEFDMGSPDDEPGRDDRLDQPRHRMTIPRSFAIGTREVTAGQFRQFKADYDGGDDAALPATAVAWYQAAEYCNWLSREEGIPPDQWCYEPHPENGWRPGTRIRDGHLNLTGYRLPTEAEWEFAARGRAATTRFYGRGTTLLDRYEWYRKQAEDSPRRVGLLRPNDFGLFDSLGNVMEWCGDAGVKGTPISGRDDGGPDEPVVGRVGEGEDKKIVYRIVRGGSHDLAPRYLRSSARLGENPSSRQDNFGFRVARTVP